MMKRVLFALVVLAGCTKAGPSETAETPAKEPGLKLPLDKGPVVTTPPTVVTTTVELTAVTLADDCGGAAPSRPPMLPSAQPTRESHRDVEGKSATKADAAMKMKRRCEQTSMQLAITSKDGKPTAVHVKSVELFDDAGKSLGPLAASTPTRWVDATSTYDAWDEQVAADATSLVSYVLAQPA
ncbi:MAG: hypothetical protein NT062_07530, partial [Proteobacteria bacterium]|nr:hypothetical protein [Pseudomonadota bacterium]